MWIGQFLISAIEKQVEVIGWCPEQRKAEDGKIPDRYPLVELKDAGYDERTEANVLDSDATLILHLGEISGGTKFTVSCCQIQQAFSFNGFERRKLTGPSGRARPIH